MLEETRHECGMAWLPKQTDRLDRALTWYGGYGLVSAALSYLAKQSVLLKPYGWPEAIFVGLGAACIMAITVAIGLMAWRKFQPLRPVMTAEPVKSDDAATIEFFDPTPIIEATHTLAKRISDHDRDIQLLEKSREDVLGILTKSNEGDQEMIPALGKSIQELFSRLSALETAQKNSSNNLDMWSRRLSDDMENRFVGVDQGFSALLDRERLISLTEQIDKDAFELSGPTRGDPLGDFEDWRGKEQKWRQLIVSWCQLAATYRFGVSERIHSTPENLYRGAWDAADSLFPNADAIIAWRTFRIIYRNFETESEVVGRAVLMAAFARPSLKSRPAVTRGEDQMPRLPPSTAP